MCIDCPNCNTTNSASSGSNTFGHNMMPMCWTCGLAVALGGSIGYQGSNDPHFHGKLHIASVFNRGREQRLAHLWRPVYSRLKTLPTTRKGSIEKNITTSNNTANTLTPTSSDGTKTTAPQTVKRCASCLTASARTTLPPFVQSTMRQMPATPCRRYGLSQAYHTDAQRGFPHWHCNWHPKDASTGERHPIRGCRSKRGIGCKHEFLQDNRIAVKPNVICPCPGNAGKHNLRVSGCRNSLGSKPSTRRCGWFSGTSPGFSTIF